MTAEILSVVKSSPLWVFGESGIGWKVMQYSQKLHYPDVQETVEYICQEIRNNVKSADVLSIRNLNQKFWISLPVGVVLRREDIVLESATFKAQAYKKWYKLVSSDSVWDHKTEIRGIQNEEWACDRTRFLKFRYDIWSNIHYGFVGKYAGFSEFELSSGAGVAQLLDNDMALKEWVQQYFSNFRDGGIIGAFDDPCDTHAVQVGYSLYDKFKGNPSGLTAEHILKELYSFYNRGKKLSIEGCGYQCEGCRKVYLKPIKWYSVCVL